RRAVEGKSSDEHFTCEERALTSSDNEDVNQERRPFGRRSYMPGHQRPRVVSSRSPQMDAFRKAEVRAVGSLVSHWHRPLHITSFLSPSILRHGDRTDRMRLSTK